MIKLIVNSALFVVVVVVGYFIYAGVNESISFEKNKSERYAEVVKRLKDIRTYEIAYLNNKKKYADSFDKLVNFLKTDSMIMVVKIGMPPDTLSEIKALELGLITRDTVKVPLMDTLFQNKKYKLDDIKYVPNTDKAVFKIGAGEVKTGSGVTVQVFEVSVENTVYLKGLPEKLIRNLDFYKDFKGLRVGSLDEANNNAGNWE